MNDWVAWDRKMNRLKWIGYLISAVWIAVVAGVVAWMYQ